MRTSIISTLICLAVTIASQAQDSSENAGFGMTAPIVPIRQTAGVHCYGRASTFAQGYLDGMANLAVAQGQKAYFRSLAHLSMTQAQRNRTANDLTRVKTYYAKREARQDYRRKQQESQQLRRELNKTRRQKVAAVADQTTLNWPAAISADVYAKQRREIEALVRMRDRMQGEYAAAADTAVRKAVTSLAKRVKADGLAGKISQVESKLARGYLFNIYNGFEQPTRPGVDLLAGN